MSNQPTRGAGPALNLRGAVDLSGLARRASAPPASAGAPARQAEAGGAPTGGPAPYVLDVTDASFVSDVVPLSVQVPVVLDFWAEWCQPCKQLSPVLERLAAEYDGRFLLAKVDLDANPQLQAAFQVQSIPAVYAVIKQQPIPLFQGALPEAHVRQYLDELLRVAEANGVTGRLAPPEGDGPVADAAEEPEEPPLPPLHQAAYDAIERDDLDAAVAAYEQALRESPADEMARLGLAQVRLLLRTRDVDPAQARQAAASAPADIAAAMVVADLDLLGGHVEDAFARLIDTVRLTGGADRETVRKHLVELFDVVGAEDPRVPKARLALANALF
ncbi:MAG: tetratricopeptide repeat protein [Kineosporiaceae bacterium]